MKYSIKIKNNLETTIDLESSSINYDEKYSCNIEEDFDKVFIEFFKKDEEEKDIYSDLDKIFTKFIIDKNKLEITNIEELIQKWQIEKKNQIFNNQNKEIISILMELSKYFENKSYLSELISNYLFMPFIFFFFRNMKGKVSKLDLYGIFIDEILKFDINFFQKEDKYIIDGKIDSEFDFIEYKKKIRNYFSIPQGKIFPLEVNLNGEIEYKGFIESMIIKAELKSENLINYVYSIEILKERDE